MLKLFKQKKFDQLTKGFNIPLPEEKEINLNDLSNLEKILWNAALNSKHCIKIKTDLNMKNNKPCGAKLIIEINFPTKVD